MGLKGGWGQGGWKRGWSLEGGLRRDGGWDKRLENAVGMGVKGGMVGTGDGIGVGTGVGEGPEAARPGSPCWCCC